MCENWLRPEGRTDADLHLVRGDQRRLLRQRSGLVLGAGRLGRVDGLLHLVVILALNRSASVVAAVNVAVVAVVALAEVPIVVRFAALVGAVAVLPRVALMLLTLYVPQVVLGVLIQRLPVRRARQCDGRRVVDNWRVLVVALRSQFVGFGRFGYVLEPSINQKPNTFEINRPIK